MGLLKMASSRHRVLGMGGFLNGCSSVVERLDGFHPANVLARLLNDGAQEKGNPAIPIALGGDRLSRW